MNACTGNDPGLHATALMKTTGKQQEGLRFSGALPAVFSQNALQLPSVLFQVSFQIRF
jgi:hypothetical protein